MGLTVGKKSNQRRYLYGVVELERRARKRAAKTFQAQVVEHQVPQEELDYFEGTLQEVMDSLGCSREEAMALCESVNDTLTETGGSLDFKLERDGEGSPIRVVKT